METQPLAFMSYTHFDKERDNGYLTKLCENLSEEVRAQSGKDFPIFQDRKNILWGQTWKERIQGSIQSVTFFIPIITPSFFESNNCLDELRLFLEHEVALNRRDLILPIYYIECPQIENGDPTGDELISAIKSRQWRVWTHLRNKSFDQSRVRDELANFAIEIRDLISHPRETTYENPKLSIAAIDKIEKEEDKIENKLPKTIIVDKNNQNYYTKINDAIDDANPGDRILIHPGIYQEGLILNKPLEIIGEGIVGSIIVQATGKSVLLFETNKGRVANLTLEQMGGGNWFCVDITQGALKLEGCNITSQGSACVSIHNNANPIIKHNLIHGCRQSGILIFDNGKGILEHNEIYENAYAGIEIKTLGDPILRHNIIRDGKQNGILIYADGRGTFEDNDILRNKFPQIAIFFNGNPLFRSNRIYDGKQNGVFIFASGLGLFEGNDISGNEYPGVAIKDGSNPIFRHNRVYNNKQNGIFIYDSSFGMLEDNDIFGNEYPGVVVKVGSNPIFRHNRIYNNKQNGIFVFDNALGLFEDNDIFGNEYPGVAIETSSKPILRQNRIYNGKKDGVFIAKGGNGLFENNKIFSNARHGILVTSKSKLTIRNNYINKNGGFAIFIENDCRCIIEDNDLRNNQVGPWTTPNDNLTNVKIVRNLV
jgi:parallel beta-helix repeat protein